MHHEPIPAKTSNENKNHRCCNYDTDRTIYSANVRNNQPTKKATVQSSKSFSFAKQMASNNNEENAEVITNYYEPNVLSMSSRSSSMYEVWDQSNFVLYTCSFILESLLHMDRINVHYT